MISDSERMALIGNALLGTAAGDADPSALAERAVKIADAVVAVLEKERETAEVNDIFKRARRPLSPDDAVAMHQRALDDILSKLPKTDAFELVIKEAPDGGRLVKIVRGNDVRELILKVNEAGQVQAKYWPRKPGESLDLAKFAAPVAALAFDHVGKRFVGAEADVFGKHDKPRRTAVAVVAELVIKGLNESGASIELAPPISAVVSSGSA